MELFPVENIYIKISPVFDGFWRFMQVFLLAGHINEHNYLLVNVFVMIIQNAVTLLTLVMGI